MNRLVSTIGMIGVLVIAYASDCVRDWFREAVGRTFDPSRSAYPSGQRRL